MKVKDYFIKGKNYFLAIVIITIIQSVLSLFTISSNTLINPLGIIKLIIVGYASYKLRFNIKESLLLGALMFLSVIWYLPFAMPVYVFMLDLLSSSLIILTNALINTGVYAGASVIGCLISKKFNKKKKK